MKTNISLELTDEQRNWAKRRLEGKDVKALLSRQELQHFVRGAVGWLSAELTRPTAPLVVEPTIQAEAHARAYAKSIGQDVGGDAYRMYLVGWYNAGVTR